MKYLILLLLLIGCSGGPITLEQIEKGKEYCKDHGGVTDINSAQVFMKVRWINCLHRDKSYTIED